MQQEQNCTDTNWTPTLDGRPGPRYRAIAGALAADVADGTLPPGTRLPTHRELARRLGVTVGTVSRAYAEAARRGVIDATVGRGSFVRGGHAAGEAVPAAIPALAEPGSEGTDQLDLSTNAPAREPVHAALRELADAAARAGAWATAADYHTATGTGAQREAGARWLTRTGLDVAADEIVPVAGAQTGQALALGRLASPGDAVLLAELTWPMVKEALRLHGLRGEPVGMDAEGIRPDALADACRRTGARVLFTMPTLNNPTTATMGEDRRRELLAVARDHGLTVVEDDIYGFLHAGRHTPLAALDRERVVHVTSLAKAVAPGVRAGFVVPPPWLHRSLVGAVRAAMLMTPPLDLEWARLAVETGIAARGATAQRSEAAARQALLRRHLGHLGPQSDDAALHAWLSLPEEWTTAGFTHAAAGRGVVLTPGDAFAVAGDPGAVRVCLGPAPSRAALTRALRAVAELMAAPPSAADPVV